VTVGWASGSSANTSTVTIENDKRLIKPPAAFRQAISSDDLAAANGQNVAPKK
jgi:hypothetical protein